MRKAQRFIDGAVNNQFTSLAFKLTLAPHFCLHWMLCTVVTGCAIPFPNALKRYILPQLLLISQCDCRNANKSPDMAACVNVSRNGFFSLRSENKAFSLTLNCGKKQIECGLGLSALLLITIRIITVVKMLWTHWAVPRESTTF